MGDEKKTANTNPIIQQLTTKVLNVINSEINKKETQVLVREKLVIPVINLVYSQLYPYIFVFITLFSIISFASISTLVCFILFYVRSSGR